MMNRCRKIAAVLAVVCTALPAAACSGGVPYGTTGSWPGTQKPAVSQMPQADQFIEMYTSIQEAFFALVSESTGISSEELFRAFDDFYVSYKYTFTADSKLLSDDEKAFALDIMDFRESVKHYDNIFALGRK